MLPLMPLALRVPPLQDSRYKTESYLDGRELIYHNGPSDGGRYSANTIIFRARVFLMPFVLLLALLTFLAGGQMFGAAAGLVAMTLLAFEPSLLAHGPFVTTDATVTGSTSGSSRSPNQLPWGSEMRRQCCAASHPIRCTHIRTAIPYCGSVMVETFPPMSTSCIGLGSAMVRGETP